MNGFSPAICFIEIPLPDVEPDKAIMNAICEFQNRLLSEFDIRTHSPITTNDEYADAIHEITGRLRAHGVSKEERLALFELFDWLYRMPQDQRKTIVEAV